MGRCFKRTSIEPVHVICWVFYWVLLSGAIAKTKKADLNSFALLGYVLLPSVCRPWTVALHGGCRQAISEVLHSFQPSACCSYACVFCHLVCAF